MQIKLKAFIKNIVFIVPVLLLSSCDAKSSNNLSTFPQDSIELTKLVRQYLNWSETNYDKRKAGDFWPTTAKPTDTLYNGIDWDMQGQNMKAIEESNYFTIGFLENYQKLSLHIDSALKSGKIIWHVGDMPDFGPSSGEANAWCNCQDHPTNYLEKVIITSLEFRNNNVSFSWTWRNNFLYHVKAKKINGEWKIDYLQGFDIKEY